MLRKILPPVAFAAGAFFLLSNDPVAADDFPGTPGDDTTTGTPGDDTIAGEAGNDTLNGGGGSDTIEGGFDNDTVNGGDESDELSGDDNHCHFNEDPGCGGNDTIDGGAGDDVIAGDDNFCHTNEELATGVANDCAGNDTINGGSEDDDLYGDFNNCDLDNTAAATCAGNDTIDGGVGDDELYGDSNDCGFDEDVAGNSAGDDTLNGGEGDDYIEGDGNFCFEGAVEELTTVDGASAAASVGVTCGGDDIINGGPGDDEIYGDGNFCGAEGSFALDDACAGDDTISGGAGDDYIEGDDNYCVIFSPDEDASYAGCAGDDTIDGGDGNDEIYGDSRDFFNQVGGEGLCDNIIRGFVAAAIPDPTEFELCFAGGNDTISGGAGDDEIFGGNGDDTIGGGTGRDLIVGDILNFFGGPIGAGYSGQSIDDVLDFLAQLSDEELNLFLAELFLLDTVFGGGNDTVSGDAGIDVVMGSGGHDVVCGDMDDPLVTGGGGSDVPCPVVEGTFNATTGSVTIDLGTGLRLLDDEMFEINETGAANPWVFVVLVAPTKGTLSFDGTKVTYTANAGATGEDSFQYAIRRRVVACPGEITVTFEGEPQTFDVCNLDLFNPQALVNVLGVDYVQSGSKTITLTLAAPVVPPVPPVPPAVAAAQEAALPVTGGGDLGLALAGLGLVALGAAVTAESKRRRNQLGALA